MRPADRLFQIVQLIRGRRLTTAAYLAERLAVSERTVYRDIAELQAQGVPLEGEAGVGYRLGCGYTLPPLMFTANEAQALVASIRMAQRWLDPALASAAQDALGRVLSVLPSAERAAAEALTLYTPFDQAQIGMDSTQQACLQVLRESAQNRVKVRITYVDNNQSLSERTVRPLGCFYWGALWTLAAWCELRQGFRNFRVDRIRALSVLEERFVDSGDTNLSAFLRYVQNQGLTGNNRERA